MWLPCDEALQPCNSAASCCSARPQALSQSGKGTPYVKSILGVLVVGMAPSQWQQGNGECPLLDV